MNFLRWARFRSENKHINEKDKISMCNQMVTGEIRNYSFHKTQVKLFPDFTSIQRDYLLISWVTNYPHKRGYFTRLVFDLLFHMTVKL